MGMGNSVFRNFRFSRHSTSQSISTELCLDVESTTASRLKIVLIQLESLIFVAVATDTRKGSLRTISADPLLTSFRVSRW